MEFVLIYFYLNIPIKDFGAFPSLDECQAAIPQAVVALGQKPPANPANFKCLQREHDKEQHDDKKTG